ncbi:type II secretion system F family protein [Microbacterium terricola]|uniref:Pilus assembly protein TadB n=1 Tax=Microbacterium terricola TaxID=344163 RepID=A0ABM8DZI2_9MICO|nr:type II secretion system F family protein [Microbacterium terricola]UYK41274.1 type II secretion system F family protein [Microbacterium terricola]BDV30946.1 pilus assembly protein TadB [Microbacterium terricola]
MTPLALAIVLGGALGLGTCLLVSLAPRWGAVSLARRIAPYIRDVTDPRGTTLEVAVPAVDVGSLWHDAQRRLAGSGSDGVQRRLRQAGWRMDAAAFRGRQLAWALIGVAAGGVLMVVLALAGTLSPAGAVIPVVLGAIGALGCDVRLTAAARGRVTRVSEELPTVLEFLSLCLAAGEGILDSLRRVGEVGAGELTAGIRVLVLSVGTGSSLPDALGELSGRLQIPALTRSVDQLVAAIDRGAPLAQVLQAQAQDAREDAKRTLIEQAGRKEIYMLFPLVFLILPLSVLIAVFPGVFMLRLGIG